MNNQFDELTKGLAQSTSRRAALKKFGTGIVGIAVAWLGLTNRAQAGKRRTGYCAVDANGLQTGFCLHSARRVKVPCPRGSGNCFIDVCDETGSLDCIPGQPAAVVSTDANHCQRYFSDVACS